MARQQWWKTCTLSSFLGFSLSLWLARWFRAPHFDRYFGACPGKSSTKSQKIWTVKQPKGRHSNCECIECVVREERRMRCFKGLRDWWSDDCDGQGFLSIVSMTKGEWLSVPQERYCSMLGSTYVPAAHRQHVDSRVRSQGEAGGGEGQPAAPKHHALALLLGSRLIVPAKDCWEICF